MFCKRFFLHDATGGTKRKQGFILLPLLLFLMVCSGIILCYGRSVYQEAAATREFLCRKQLETIAQSFMFTALQREKETEITNAAYNLDALQPGNDKVQISVTVNRVKDLGMRFLKVDVSDSCSNEFSLRQCGLFFPDSLLHQFAESSLVVTDSSVQGKSEKENMGSITGNSDGAVFPRFSVEEIIYLCRNEISLPKGLQVNGDGILAFANDVTIGDNAKFTGRIIILADCNVRLESNVKLEKALLLCRGKLTLGTDSIIKGAVMARQGVVLADTSEIICDREVLEPFNSIISY